MPQLVNFSISTPSRHPANQNGYVSDLNRPHYRADYVTPEFWILNLHAIPFGLSESSDGKPIIPTNIASFQWTVKQVEGTFSKTVTQGRSPSMMHTRVRIPKPGEYEITLQVNVTNGEPEVHTRNYRLRDFLIVGIGDSFASGQGNPDVPAIPSLDEKIICETTTIALALTKVKESFNAFLTALKKETKEKIEDYLPFIGKMVVAEINGVEDVVGYVNSKIGDLRGIVVDVASTVAEGVEEFASWFSIGDGGESGEIRSRPAAWQEPKAYRSYRSGQSLAARQVETDTLFGADRITFLSFARTGSEIDDGLLAPRTVDPFLLDNRSLDEWVQNRGQIQEAKDTVQNRQIDALIITIGVNDLGFTTLVRRSLLWTSGERRTQRIRGVRRRLNEEFPIQLDNLRNAIESQLNPRKVFITEYPVGIFKELETQKPCGILGSFSVNNVFAGFNVDDSDAKDMGALGRLLNAQIRAKADEFGWVFIDGIEQGFDGHGYCANRSFFVSAEESCRNQGDFEGTLHPNKLGHEVTRDCIARALQKELLAPQQNWLEPVLNVMMQ